MRLVNMLQAKSALSKLVEDIEQGKHPDIIIIRNGRPAAKLVPIDAAPTDKRIGVAKGKFKAPDDIDTHNDEIAHLFSNGASS